MKAPVGQDGRSANATAPNVLSAPAVCKLDPGDVGAGRLAMAADPFVPSGRRAGPPLPETPLGRRTACRPGPEADDDEAGHS